MSDTDNLMPLEDDAPASSPAPPAAPDPAPVEPPAEPVAAAPPPSPAAPAEPAEPSDPRTAGILRELRETRERERQWKQQAEAGYTLAQRLQANPRAMAALAGQEPAAVSEPDPPADRAELEALARQNVWYDKDGQPDVAMAAKHLDLVTKRAEERAYQRLLARIQPLEQAQTQSVAQARMAEAYAVTDQLQIPRETAAIVIDGLMQTKPELMADQNSATVATLVALGLHALKQKQQPAAAAPAAATPPAPRPVFVEQGSGNRPAAAGISPLGQRLMRTVGVSPKAWQAQTAAYEAKANRALMSFDSEEDK